MISWSLVLYETHVGIPMLSWMSQNVNMYLNGVSPHLYSYPLATVTLTASIPPAVPITLSGS